MLRTADKNKNVHKQNDDQAAKTGWTYMCY